MTPKIENRTQLAARVAEIKQDVLDTLILVIDFQASLQGELTPSLATHGRRLVAGLYASCFGVFRGVATLLAEDMTHEALMLVPTLIQDSTTLAYFHKRADRLEELALSYAHHSFVQQKGLEKEAEAIGFSRPEKMKLIDESLADVRTVADELGIKRIKKLPELRDMLKDLDFVHLYRAYKEASMVVHSTVLALGSRLASAGIDFAEERPYEATSTFKLGRNCAEAFMTANIATAHLLDLGNVSKWAETRERVREIFDRLRHEDLELSAAAKSLHL